MTKGNDHDTKNKLKRRLMFIVQRTPGVVICQRKMEKEKKNAQIDVKSGCLII